MINPNMAHFKCACCARVLAIDKRVPPEVIRDEFAVMGLQRVEVDGDKRFTEHPLVCSDACHAVANRTGLPGWDGSPGNQRDHDTEVVMPERR